MNLMKLFAMAHQAQRLREQAGDGGDNGGSPDGGDNGGGENGNDNGGQEGDGDGKPKPTDQEAKLLREVMQKKTKIDELGAANSELSERLKALEESLGQYKGVDVEEFNRLKQEAAQREEQELVDKGDWEAMKQRLEEQHQSQLQQVIDQNKSEFQQQLEEREGKLSETEQEIQSLRSTIEELTVGTAFGNSAYIKEELGPYPPKIRKLYGEYFDVVDGKIQAFNQPRGAENRELLVGGDGKPLAFDAALHKIVENDPDKDSIKKAKVVSGSGSGSENRDTKAPAGDVRGIDRIRSGLESQG